MEGILKLNPLILEQIHLLKISEEMKKFLEEVLRLELINSQKNDEKFTTDYEKLVESFFSGK